MKKILISLLIFILSLPFILLLGDLIVYRINTNSKLNGFEGQKFKYISVNPYIFNISNKEFFSETNKIDQENRARVPDGKDYNNNRPIVIFGGSFAYGEFLKQKQIFSYKLAKILKRTVYNRAMPGGGVQYMYYQSQNDNFFDQIPHSDTVIYIMITDHYRRMLGEPFCIGDDYLYLHYKIKNNDLVMDNYKNYILNICKSSYTLRIIRSFIKNSFINNPKNQEKITDDILLYFMKTRSNLEQKWNNKIKFYIIFYDDVLYSDILKKKLEDNNFIVISTNDLTNEDLSSEKYLDKDNRHPTEDAWDLITPKIADELLRL